MSDFLRILENEVQLVALAFLVTVYTIRIVWLFRFRSEKEKTFPEGSAARGILFSMMNVAMPWAMASTRRHPFFYIQFVIFHLGVVTAISATFIIPYWPELFENRMIVTVFQVICAAAFFVGLLRLFRRITNRAIRLVSSLDDYFSLTLMIVFFALAVIAVPNQYETREWPLIWFFALTTFFLFYVPFSKIGHYLYYPFTRFFLGRTMGHRGVVSKKEKK